MSTRPSIVAAVAVLLAFTLSAGCTPEDGGNEEVILEKAKSLRKEGVAAFGDWRRVDPEDTAARKAAFNTAQDKLQAAKAEYEKLWNNHSSLDSDGMRIAKPGYEFIERDITEINDLLHDLAKDSFVGD